LESPDAIGDVQRRIFNSRTSSFIDSDGDSKMTSHQRSTMINSIKSMISEDLVSRQHLQDRLLAEGDWLFLNDFLQTFNFTVPVNETVGLGNIDFDLKTIVCEDFGVRDIVTEGTGNNTEYDLTFSISGVTMKCHFDYR
jgi:hypothetical protein